LGHEAWRSRDEVGPMSPATRKTVERELELLRGFIDFARTHLERGNDEAVREATHDAKGHLATIASLVGPPGGEEPDGD
jgi:hypothetical protein